MSSQERIKIIYTSKMNIWTKFEGPRSILCVVIMYTMFGLYIIKLKATVTLTFKVTIAAN